MATTRAATIAFMLSILICSAASAKVSIYLRNGEQIEAQNAWRDDDNVQVLVNRNTLLEFQETEVDLQKSKLKKKPQKNLLDQVIQTGGIRKQLENMLKSSSTDDEFDTVLLDNYDVNRAEKVVRRHFSRKLDEESLAKVLTWLKSPVGRKITNAESVSDEVSKEQMEAFLNQEATPEMEERMQLMLDIERRNGSSELAIHLAGRMVRKVAKAVPADLPGRAEFIEKLFSNVPALDALQTENAAETAYALRALSLDELRYYLRFLDSPAGKKYSKATLDAAAEIFGTIMDKLGDALGSELTIQINSARNEGP